MRGQVGQHEAVVYVYTVLERSMEDLFDLERKVFRLIVKGK